MAISVGEFIIGGVAIGAMVLVPLAITANRQDDIIQEKAKVAVTNFVDEATSASKITPQAYSELEEELQSSTGVTFNIELEHQKQSDTVGKKSSWTSSGVTGEMLRTSTFTSEIVEKLDRNENYDMKKGDNLICTAENTSQPPSQVFSLFKIGASTIRVQDSRMVQ